MIVSRSVPNPSINQEFNGLGLTVNGSRGGIDFLYLNEPALNNKRALEKILDFPFETGLVRLRGKV